MLRFSIRTMTLGVVGLAIVFTIIAAFQRSAADRDKQRCEQNLRNVSLAIQGYLYNKSAIPTGTCPNPDLAHDDRLGWNAEVSSYYDYAGLHNSIDWTEAWNVGVNAKIARIDLRILRCPNLPAIAPGGTLPTTYLGIAGLGTDAPLLLKRDPRAGVFGYDRQTTLADIKDGAANTLLIAETAQVSGSWFQGGPATVRGLDPAQKPYIGPGRQFGGLHQDGACVAMADGSVRWVRDSTSPKVFEALSTMAGGESLPTNW